MKKYYLIFILASLFLILTSCNKEDIEDISGELMEYYNENWISIRESKTEKKYPLQIKLFEIEREQDATLDQQRLEVIELMEKELIPDTDDAIKQFQKIELKHQKVKELNDMQIEVERLAREMLEAGIDYYKGDISESELEEMEGELSSKKDDVVDYINQLMEEYDLEFNKDEKNVEGLYEMIRK